jgi:hypothetical protein
MDNIYEPKINNLKINNLNEKNWVIGGFVGNGGYSYIYDCSYINNNNENCYETNFDNYGFLFPNKIKIQNTDLFVIKIPNTSNDDTFYILFENFNFNLQLMILSIVPRVIDYGIKDDKFCFIMDKYMSNGDEYYKKIIKHKNFKELVKKYFENVIKIIRKLAKNSIFTMDIKNSNIVVNYDENYELLDMKFIDIDILFTNITSEITKNENDIFLLMVVIWYVYSTYGNKLHIFTVECFDLFRELLHDLPIKMINSVYNLQGRYQHPITDDCYYTEVHKENIKCFCDTITYSQILCLALHMVESFELKYIVSEKMFSNCINKIILSLKSKKNLNNFIDEIHIFYKK